MTGNVDDLYFSWECSFSDNCGAGKTLIDGKYCVIDTMFVTGAAVFIQDVPAIRMDEMMLNMSLLESREKC